MILPIRINETAKRFHHHQMLIFKSQEKFTPVNLVRLISGQRFPQLTIMAATPRTISTILATTTTLWTHWATHQPMPAKIRTPKAPHINILKRRRCRNYDILTWMWKLTTIRENPYIDRYIFEEINFVDRILSC